MPNISEFGNKYIKCVLHYPISTHPSVFTVNVMININRGSNRTYNMMVVYTYCNYNRVIEYNFVTYQN